MRALTGLALLLAYYLSAIPAHGQDPFEPVVIGQRAEIESRFLDETRSFLISTPPGYDAAGERYSVLYVLDGDLHFTHSAVTANFLASNDRIPGLIVVGILNTDRNRDLMPPGEDDDTQEPNGANRFLNFLSQELVPWVDQEFRTRPYKVLMGHSFGGLFALHGLTTSPNTFSAYIVVSPSFQWNDQVRLRAEQFFIDTPELDASLFLSLGNEGGAMLGGLRKLAGTLDTQAPDGLRWDFSGPMEAESHGSVPLPAVREGLESIFDGWDVMDDAYSKFGQGQPGIEIAEIDEIYRRSGEPFGYERDPPYSVVMDFSKYLIESGRLDEAADLLLRDPADYRPVPEFQEMLAIAYIESGNQSAAMEFFNRLIDAVGDAEAATRIRQRRDQILRESDAD